VFRFQNGFGRSDLLALAHPAYNARTSEDHIMERPGQRLKRVRERLKLTFRDVEEASQQVASRRGSDEFAIALSRLADIENKGTIPSIYRIYTLCAIYRLDPEEVLRWYGVPLDQLSSEALQIRLDETHELHFAAPAAALLPQPHTQRGVLDLEQTVFLSPLIQRWGKMPLAFLAGLDVRQYRYGLIGLQDWSMYPVLHPGSLVVIDQNLRKIVSGGWTNEHDRPIYFFEHRQGYLCGWCALNGDRLLLQPHPASQQNPRIFDWKEIDVIGQVTAVAMLLVSRTRRPSRSAGVPKGSPDP
jgi:transcriptional regulator with XRE-family HTH domain